MFDQSNLFTSIFLIPILNILIAIYKLLLFLHIPNALGFSLILLTVVIRLILHPLTVTQLKSAYKLNKLKPQIDDLSKKHKNDKTRLQQEQMKLYQKEGINPAAGCLPILLQMPILIALYNLFFKLLSNGNLSQMVQDINKVIYYPFLKINSLELHFFGVSLAYKPSDWQSKGWWLLLIPVITGLLQYWQTKLMTPKTPVLSNKLENLKNDVPKKEDMGTTMQKQMSIMMPLMIGFFAYSFPLGLSLYWNTFTVFGIIQQYHINNIFEKENDKSKK